MVDSYLIAIFHAQALGRSWRCSGGKTSEDELTSSGVASLKSQLPAGIFAPFYRQESHSSNWQGCGEIRKSKFTLPSTEAEESNLIARCSLASGLYVVDI